MVLVLKRCSVDRLVSLCCIDEGVYKQIYSEIKHLLGEEHARIFACPEYSGEFIRWTVEGKESLTWKELSPSQQKELQKATCAILSDIRQCAIDHPETVFSRYFSDLSRFPSLSYLYAVDGYPVITGWGYKEGQHVFDPLSHIPIKERTFLMRIWKFPWITAIIALLLGLLVSLIWHIKEHKLAVCKATYPDSEMVKDALLKEKQHQDLSSQRELLLRQWEDLQRQCKIPSIPPLKPNDVADTDPLEPLQDPPKLPPIQKMDKLPSVKIPDKQVKKEDLPDNVSDNKKYSRPNKQVKKEDLPEEAWKKKDTSFLKGCWHLSTRLYIHGNDGIPPSPITNWHLCFDGSGRGQQNLTAQDGTRCSGPLQAQFHGNQLVLTQPRDCMGQGLHMTGGRQECTRLNDHEANCNYFPNGYDVAPGIFRR